MWRSVVKRWPTKLASLYVSGSAAPRSALSAVLRFCIAPICLVIPTSFAQLFSFWNYVQTASPTRLQANTTAHANTAAHSAEVLPLPSGELDASLDRHGTHAKKVEGPDRIFVGKDVIPMWIADMDFRAPQPIVDAVVACAAHGVYG